jgi:hypothetical protein
MTYLENTNELLNDSPVFLVELVLAQLERLVGCDRINGYTIFESKFHHIVSRVPPGNDVSWNKLGFEFSLFAVATPGNKRRGRRMYDCER